MRRELPVEEVKKIAGHTTIQMTEYYTKSEIEELISVIKNTIDAANNLFQ